MYDYTEEFDSGWSYLLDEAKRKGESSVQIFIPWGAHESIRGVRDFSKSPRLRLERFLGLAHERSLSVEAVLGFPPSLNAFPPWALADSASCLIPRSAWHEEAWGGLLTTVPSLQDPAIRQGFFEFCAEVCTVLSLYRRPEGPVVSLDLNLGVQNYSLSASQTPGFAEKLSQRYGEIKTVNTLYGTYFRDFESLTVDGAIRSMIAKRPWLFAFDYQWCRNRLHQDFLSEILSHPSVVPMLSLIAEPVRRPSSSSKAILFEGTMLNTFGQSAHLFAPTRISSPAFNHCYELYGAVKDLAAEDGLPLQILSDSMGEERLEAQRLEIVCGKFLQKRDWEWLLSLKDTEFSFPLEVPQYDEWMKRYEVKGERPKSDLRAALAAYHGDARPWLNTSFPREARH